MPTGTSIEKILFEYLMKYEFDEKDLDYSILDKHKKNLQILSEVSNSGIGVFDVSKKQTLFYSSNFGESLGYQAHDYEDSGQQFFENKIHDDDKRDLGFSFVAVFKLFDDFTSEEKLNHKLIYEYRMLNIHNQYVRLVKQYQVLELDKTGKVWLILSIVDISPDQEEFNGSRSQLLNFRTGEIIHLEAPTKVRFELTKREMEILKMVKEGYLSKEISDKLAISVHTVNTHRQRFLEKLGANNSFEAIMFASKLGLLE